MPVDTNEFKAALRRGEQKIGLWLGLGEATTAELAGAHEALTPAIVASCASMDSSAGRAVHPCDAYLHVTGCELIIDLTWWLPSRTASTPPRRGIVMRAFDSGQRGCLASACRMHARQYVWTLPRGETGSSKTSVHIAQETVSRTWRPAALRSSSSVRRWRFVGRSSAASAISVGRVLSGAVSEMEAIQGAASALLGGFSSP